LSAALLLGAEAVHEPEKAPIPAAPVAKAAVLMKIRLFIFMILSYYCG
jgi:hypothetical protein